MKAWQRKIREKEAQKDPRPVVGLEKAIVVEISYEKAREVILKYEWLRTMGSTERSFGLILDGELAGVCCFGKTGGTDTAKSVCGEEWAQYVVTLCRGACCHWSHPHSASYLISRACKLMANSGRRRGAGKFSRPRTSSSLIRTLMPGKLEPSTKALTGLHRKNFWHDHVP